jgi:hypothetical protein
MLVGAPISMLPHDGGFAAQVQSSSPLSKLETAVILLMKLFMAFEWVIVLARVVQVYNNMDPDNAEFRSGWDALNRFVTYFKVSKADATELRRYYVERAEEARAKSRMRVMNDFSPFLAEKFVWKVRHPTLAVLTSAREGALQNLSSHVYSTPPSLPPWCTVFQGLADPRAVLLPRRRADPRAPRHRPRAIPRKGSARDATRRVCAD